MFRGRKRAIPGDSVPSDTAKSTPLTKTAPLRVSMLSAQEALARIDGEDSTTQPLRKLLAVPSAPSTAPLSSQLLAPMTPKTPSSAGPPAQTQQEQLLPSERVLLRRQREEPHEYGRRGTLLQHWNALARIVAQSCATNVIAESAADLSKWGVSLDAQKRLPALAMETVDTGVTAIQEPEVDDASLE